MPIYFGPGVTRSSNITRQIINRQQQSGENPNCVCLPQSTNKRVYDTSYTNSEDQVINRQIIVNPDNTQTQNQRIATTIRTSLGGRVQYGNPGIPQSTTFLGKTAGQPGGIIGSLRLRNKF